MAATQNECLSIKINIFIFFEVLISQFAELSSDFPLKSLALQIVGESEK